jgi:hypothetical protein
MTKKTISLPEIKRQLKTYSSDELISIVMDCYKLSEDVKNYVHVMLDPEGAAAEIHEKAKKTIVNEFYPERGEPKLRYSVAKKAISDFAKLSTDINLLLDLMITYVEQGVEFTDEYGDIDERFYNSMESMYSNVLSKIHKTGGYGLFLLNRDRLKAIVDKTRDVGWGFGDALADMYYEVASAYNLLEVE